MEKTQNKLPRSKWIFILIGIPTFYMPLAYLIMAIWAIGGMIFNYDLETPIWLLFIIGPAYFVTIALWPIYIVWVLFSKRLTKTEKLKWLFIVILMNMLGMPWFYVTMVRRYLGLENQSNQSDKKVFENFTRKNKINLENLSTKQKSILISHCRKRRFQKRGIIFSLPIIALLLYMAIIYIPDKGIQLSSNFIPTKTLIIDSVNNTTNEILPLPLLQKSYVKIIMFCGAFAGVTGFSGLFLLANCIRILFIDKQHKLLIDFIKAAEK